MEEACAHVANAMCLIHASESAARMHRRAVRARRVARDEARKRGVECRERLKAISQHAFDVYVATRKYRLARHILERSKRSLDMSPDCRMLNVWTA